MNAFYATRANLTADLFRGLPLGARVLDVGCGSGALVLRLTAAGFRTTGIDLSAAQIERIKEAVAAACPPVQPDFRVGGLEVLSDAERYDAVCALGVLPYIEDQPAFVRALARHVERKGLLVLSQTRAASLFTLKALLNHARNFTPRTAWFRIALNLLRTGVWSGGFVDPTQCVPLRSLGVLDSVLSDLGFCRVHVFALFNVRRLDTEAVGKSRVGRWLARRLGWCVVAAYERIG